MKKPIFSYRFTDYDRRLLPSDFLASLEESNEGPEHWIASSGRSIGHPGWGLMYHMVLAVLDPEADNLIVETGTNVGSTTIVLAKALKDSRRRGVVRTVEIDPTVAAEAQRRVQLVGLADLVEFYRGDSLAILPEMMESPRSLAVAFLDGNHFHDHVLAEFELVVPHIHDRSVVVFDNTALISEGDEDPRVNGALRTIIARYGGHLINPCPFALGTRRASPSGNGCLSRTCRLPMKAHSSRRSRDEAAVHDNVLTEGGLETGVCRSVGDLFLSTGGLRRSRCVC